MVHSHTVHLPLGALLTPCAMWRTGSEMRFIDEMVRRGFAAVTADYDSAWLSYLGGCNGFNAKARAMFEGPSSALGQVCKQAIRTARLRTWGRTPHPYLTQRSGNGQVCARPDVDCDAGVALHGWSQAGPRMAHSHTVHLPLGALLSPCTMCGPGLRARTSRRSAVRTTRV